MLNTLRMDFPAVNIAALADLLKASEEGSDDEDKVNTKTSVFCFFYY